MSQSNPQAQPFDISTIDLNQILTAMGDPAWLKETPSSSSAESGATEPQEESGNESIVVSSPEKSRITPRVVTSHVASRQEADPGGWAKFITAKPLPPKMVDNQTQEILVEPTMELSDMVPNDDENLQTLASLIGSREQSVDSGPSAYILWRIQR